MRRIILTYLILLGILTTGFSQTRNIVGRIVSNNDQKPVKNAKISIKESAKSAITNHLGFFTFELTDEDIGPLIISHVGYMTSEVEIPKIDNFKIVLNKEYIHVAEFDLGYFKERDLDLVVESEALTTEGEISARYPGGWEHFFNDLGRALLKTKFNKELRGDILDLQFKVTDTGSVEDFNLEPHLSISDSIKEQFQSLKKWIPASQFGKPSEQYFKLTLKWSFVLEDPARPVGGMTAFYHFVGDNLNYPSKARRANIQGVVFIEFFIEVDGTISEVKSVKPIGGGLDEEAIRVILLSPKWIPGMKDGEPVRQRMVLPITFKLG